MHTDVLGSAGGAGAAGSGDGLDGGANVENVARGWRSARGAYVKFLPEVMTVSLTVHLGGRAGRRRILGGTHKREEIVASLEGDAVATSGGPFA